MARGKEKKEAALFSYLKRKGKRPSLKKSKSTHLALSEEKSVVLFCWKKVCWGSLHFAERERPFKPGGVDKGREPSLRERKADPHQHRIREGVLEKKKAAFNSFREKTYEGREGRRGKLKKKRGGGVPFVVMNSARGGRYVPIH